MSNDGYQMMWSMKVMTHAWDIIEGTDGHTYAGEEDRLGSICAAITFFCDEPELLDMCIDFSGLPRGKVLKLGEAALICRHAVLKKYLTEKYRVYKRRHNKIGGRAKLKVRAMSLQDKIHDVGLCLKLISPYEGKELTDTHNVLLVKMYDMKKRFTVVG